MNFPLVMLPPAARWPQLQPVPQAESACRPNAPLDTLSFPGHSSPGDSMDDNIRDSPQSDAYSKMASPAAVMTVHISLRSEFLQPIPDKAGRNRWPRQVSLV